MDLVGMGELQMAEKALTPAVPSTPYWLMPMIKVTY